MKNLVQYKDSLIAWDFMPPMGFIMGSFCVIEDNVEMGKNVVVGDYVKIPEGSIIGDNTIIGSYVRLGKNCKIGKNCIIKIRTTISPDTVIGDNVFMGPHSMILHATPDGTHKPSTIKDNAWIGACALIGPDVTIAKGVLLGAMAFAHKNCDIEDGTYLGSPARFIRSKNRDTK